MNAQSTVQTTEASPYTVSYVLRNAPPQFFQALIAGISVRFFFQCNQIWFKLRDIHTILGYAAPKTGTVRRLVENHGYNLDDFLLRAPEGRNAAMFLSAEGLRIVSELCKPERTDGLRKWLEDGGLSALMANAPTSTHFATPLQPGSAQPPEVAQILGTAATEGSGECADAPTAYVMLPADFNGALVTLIPYGEKMGIAADQVAMLLRDEQHDVREIMALIDTLAGAETVDMTALVWIGGLGTVRVLDKRAVRQIDCHLGTEKSEALADWFEAQLDQILAVTSLGSEGETDKETPEPAAPVADSLAALDQLKSDLYIAFVHVAAQVRAIKRVAQDGDDPRMDDVYNLAEVAESLSFKLDDLIDRLDEIDRDLNSRLTRRPGDEDRVPEFVWLGVIEELCADRPKWNSEDMWRLCQHLNALRSHTPHCPEAGAAVDFVKGYAERLGATIYLHEPSGRISHAWQPGRAPHQRH